MSAPSSMVYIIDDDASVRDALGRLVRSVGLAVETFGSTQEFLQSRRPAAASCMVLDVRLPGKSGIDFHRELVASGSGIPVIFITAHGDIPMSVQAMKAGAIEFLPKPFRDQDLLDAINIALEKDRVRRKLEAEIAVLQDRLAELTPREQEVLPLVVSGLPNKQIAALIGTSEGSVKVHRAQLMRKMGADSVADLVRITEKLGIPPTKH
jgi:RNA polymerase sigma factor (sigma-70 family)